MNLDHAVQSLTSSPLVLIAFMLGVYGWWRLIARDSILDRPRRWLYLRFPHEGFVDQKVRPKRGVSVYSSGVWYTQVGTFIGELIYCPFCLSWWIAVAQFFVYAQWPHLVVMFGILHGSRIAAGFLSKHA